MVKFLESMRFEYATGFMMGGISQEEIYCFGNDDIQLLIYPTFPRIDLEIVGLGSFMITDEGAVELLRNFIKVKKKEPFLKDTLSSWFKEHPHLLVTE